MDTTTLTLPTMPTTESLIGPHQVKVGSISPMNQPQSLKIALPHTLSATSLDHTQSKPLVHVNHHSQLQLTSLNHLFYQLTAPLPQWVTTFSLLEPLPVTLSEELLQTALPPHYKLMEPLLPLTQDKPLTHSQASALITLLPLDALVYSHHPLLPLLTLSPLELSLLTVPSHQELPLLPKGITRLSLSQE